MGEGGGCIDKRQQDCKIRRTLFRCVYNHSPYLCIACIDKFPPFPLSPAHYVRPFVDLPPLCEISFSV